MSGTGCSGAASEAMTHSCQPTSPWTSWPYRVAGVLGLDDSAETEAAHGLADANGRQVGRHVVDPGTVGGIERDPLGSYQRLTVVDLGKLLLVEFEGVRPDAPARALAQQEATVAHCHALTLPRVAGCCAHPSPRG